MLNTKFHGNRPTRSGEEDFLSGFYHIILWASPPSWSYDPVFVIKLEMPLPKEAPHKIST